MNTWTNDVHPLDEQDREMAAMASYESDDRYCHECERHKKTNADIEDGMLWCGPCREVILGAGL